MKSCKYLLFAIAVACQSLMAQEIPSCPKILDYTQKHLPLYGTLKNSAGFVYVDLDDDYIHKLVTFIEKDGFVEPPYFDSGALVGAHITVIYPEEMQEYGIKTIQEIGKKIPFTPTSCQIIHPTKMPVEEVYFIVVKAPELDRIRTKYGLPKRQYDFHITIGVKPQNPSSQKGS